MGAASALLAVTKAKKNSEAEEQKPKKRSKSDEGSE